MRSTHKPVKRGGLRTHLRGTLISVTVIFLPLRDTYIHNVRGAHRSVTGTHRSVTGAHRSVTGTHSYIQTSESFTKILSCHITQLQPTNVRLRGDINIPHSDKNMLGKHW